MRFFGVVAVVSVGSALVVGGVLPREEKAVDEPATDNAIALDVFSTTPYTERATAQAPRRKVVGEREDSEVIKTSASVSAGAPAPTATLNSVVDLSPNLDKAVASLIPSEHFEEFAKIEINTNEGDNSALVEPGHNHLTDGEGDASDKPSIWDLVGGLKEYLNLILFFFIVWAVFRKHGVNGLLALFVGGGGGVAAAEGGDPGARDGGGPTVNQNTVNNNILFTREALDFIHAASILTGPIPGALATDLELGDIGTQHDTNLPQLEATPVELDSSITQEVA
ncbi:hypothetical protein OQA88_12198 [Cercophora sp. LCS_1]